MVALPPTTTLAGRAELRRAERDVLQSFLHGDGSVGLGIRAARGAHECVRASARAHGSS
jgi:hypothetical protein